MDSKSLPAEGCCTLSRHSGLGRSLVDLKRLQKHRKWIEVVPSLRELGADLADGKAPWPLLLHGEAGSGKTCAALCLIDLYGGLYATTGELCDLVIAAQKGELAWSSGYKRTVGELWKQWECEEGITVLDELGARGQVSDFHYETIKRAIDAREGRPAIFISNNDLAHLARVYDDRIASRLGAGSVFRSKGDRRIASRVEKR